MTFHFNSENRGSQPFTIYLFNCSILVPKDRRFGIVDSYPHGRKPYQAQSYARFFRLYSCRPRPFPKLLRNSVIILLPFSGGCISQRSLEKPNPQEMYVHMYVHKLLSSVPFLPLFSKQAFLLLSWEQKYFPDFTVQAVF